MSVECLVSLPSLAKQWNTDSDSRVDFQNHRSPYFVGVFEWDWYRWKALCLLFCFLHSFLNSVHFLVVVFYQTRGLSSWKTPILGYSGSGISEFLVSRHWEFDFMSLKNRDISNLSPGAVGVVRQGCTAQIWAPKSKNWNNPVPSTISCLRTFN